MLLVILLVIFVIGGIATILILRDTARRKGRWGVNLKLPRCPKCGEPAPMIRKPTSARQAAWGGWTCTKCGCEMDKWGAEIQKESLGASAPKLMEKQERVIELDASGKTPLERVLGEGKGEQ